MPRYVVFQPIEHDGKRVEFGTIELTEKEAAPLLAIGHIGQPKARAARTSTNAPSAVQTPVPPPLASQPPTSPEGEGDQGDGDDGEEGEGEGDEGTDDDSTGGTGAD